MDILRLATVLQLFVCVFAYRESEVKRPGSIGELISALNTSGPVWLLRRTYTEENHTCVYSVKKSLSNTEYVFTQYYMDNNKPVQHLLYAHLYMTGELEGASMRVSTEKGAATGKEYGLHTWDEDNHCAILYLRNHNGQQHCELYAWNDDVAEAEKNCLSNYELYCENFKKNEQIVYFDTCTVQTGC
uniref:Lipocalin n=1 Tax=Rhipicephalus appendiculatus TaxID=34631 RepID=A0A131YSK5_RHIAP